MKRSARWLPLCLLSAAWLPAPACAQDAVPAVARAVVMVLPDNAALRPLTPCCGFMVDRTGLVVTVAHALHGAAFVTVVVEDAREVSAEVVGVDVAHDLAVLRLARSLPRALSLGSSRRVAEGTPLLVTGYPLEPARKEERVEVRARTLERTVTALLQIPGFAGGRVTNFLQLDRALESRDFGAPVTGTRDHGVIGVVTQEIRPWSPHQVVTRTVVPVQYLSPLLEDVRQGHADVPEAYRTTRLPYKRVDDTPAWLHVRSLPLVPEAPEATVPLPDVTLPAGELPLEIGDGRMLADPQRPRLYVTEAGRQSLTVVNTATATIEKRLLIGPQPVGLALSPDNKTLYVAVMGSHELVMLDLETLKIRERLLLGFDPYEIVCVAPDRLYLSAADDGPRARFQLVNPLQRTWMQGSDLWRKSFLATVPGRDRVVAAFQGLSAGEVFCCDWSTDALTLSRVARNMDFLGTTRDLHVSPDGARVYLCAAQQQVLVLDGRTFAPIQTLASPAWPRHAVPTPDGKHVCVTVGAAWVNVHDVASGDLLGYFQTRSGVANLLFTPDGSRCILQFDKSLGLVDSKQLTLRPPHAPKLAPPPQWQPLPRLAADTTGELPLPAGRLPGGGLPVLAGAGQMLHDPLRPRLYVCEEKSNALAIVDTRRGAIEKRLALGPQPLGLALSPNIATLYVGLVGSKRIAVVDTETLQIKEYLQLELEPFALACPTPSRLYVTSRGPARWNGYYVINPLDGTCLRSGGLHGNCPIAVRPGGSTFFIWEPTLSSTLYRGDAAGDPLYIVHPFPDRVTPVHALCFSPDGKRVYIYGEQVRIVDADTLAELSHFKMSRPSPFLAASLDGQRLYATPFGRSCLDVLDSNTGAVLGSLPLSGLPTGLEVLESGALALQFSTGLWLLDPTRTPLRTPRQK